MRIIEIVNNWPAEVFIQRHLEALTNLAFPVEVVARHDILSYKNSASVQQAENVGYHASVMPNFDHITSIDKVWNLRFLLKSSAWNITQKGIRNRVLLGYFEHLRPDLIHFHNASLAVKMGWIAKKIGIPYTFSIRGTDVQILPVVMENYREELAETIVNAAGIHSVCDALSDIAISVFSTEKKELFFQTIYTTVPIRETPPIKGRVSDDHAPYEFITVGRLHWTKAYVNLLLAIKQLHAQGVDAKLCIVGDGPERESLLYWINVLEIADQVNLAGKLPYEEFRHRLQHADAFIQSSIAEGFSNATAEAMALGLPVFATDVGGTSEIIKDGENGFLLDPIRPEAWWRKLVLAQDHALMQGLGCAAWETAREYFAADRHAKDFIAFYKKALND